MITFHHQMVGIKNLQERSNLFSFLTLTPTTTFMGIARRVVMVRQADTKTLVTLETHHVTSTNKYSTWTATTSNIFYAHHVAAYRWSHLTRTTSSILVLNGGGGGGPIPHLPHLLVATSPLVGIPSNEFVNRCHVPLTLMTVSHPHQTHVDHHGRHDEIMVSNE